MNSKYNPYDKFDIEYDDIPYHIASDGQVFDNLKERKNYELNILKKTLYDYEYDFPKKNKIQLKFPEEETYKVSLTIEVKADSANSAKQLAISQMVELLETLTPEEIMERLNSSL